MVEGKGSSIISTDVKASVKSRLKVLEMKKNLLDSKSNVFSQNGEDGIINALFSKIGIKFKTCCEFGAWDGVHFSNCRNIVLQGWKCLFIESDTNKYTDLCKQYEGISNVINVNCCVDNNENSLEKIMNSVGFHDLDFLSIDIDGLDYEILEGLAFRPRIICVEVNAGHAPDSSEIEPREIAANNIGRPLKYFTDIAKKLGYDLVCYTGNAFFVLHSELEKSDIEILTSVKAYTDFLLRLESNEKFWLYKVNLGIVPPFRKFNNPYLNGFRLHLSPIKILETIIQLNHWNPKTVIKQFFISKNK